MTIKANDYDIVEQLKKQAAEISLFDLIHSSDNHRNMLEKFLAETHVPAQIKVNALDTFMGNMLAPNVISFSDEDFPETQVTHNNALFITLKCRNTWVPKALIDGGSGLPESCLVIRGFDGAKHRALGEISLEIEVGPVAFDTTFQILDAAGSFNMLLGHPWFAHEGKLVTIRGEHDVPICNDIEVPYLREPCGEPSTAQAVEIISMLRQDGGITSPFDSGTANAARYMLKYGYQIGQGLGARGQGRPQPINVVSKNTKDKSGLGY